METFYLIDFENVHNDGITNIESMTKEEHVHIFSTQNATNIRQDISFVSSVYACWWDAYACSGIY